MSSDTTAALRLCSLGAIPLAWRTAAVKVSGNMKISTPYAPNGRYLKMNVPSVRTLILFLYLASRHATSSPNLSRIWHRMRRKNYGTNLTRCPDPFLARSCILSISASESILAFLDPAVIRTSVISSLISPSSEEIGALRYASSSDSERH